MENYGLDLHGEMLLEEYRQQLPLYKRLMEVMKSKTAEIINEGELTVASMEFRIKEEASLAGKLQRKGSKYGTLRDITDIFGGRIIMYYNEDVDRVASFVESKLEIDWPNSVDKRKMHEVDSFGYNSLHYICRIPKTFFYDPEYPDLNDIRFEIQMRTALQHVWSAIQHDIGYKSEIETPKEYHRMLSRLAGMMELADDEFSRIRNSIADYRRRMQNLVLNGHASVRQTESQDCSHHAGRDSREHLHTLPHRVAPIGHQDAGRRGASGGKLFRRCLSVGIVPTG